MPGDDLPFLTAQILIHLVFVELSFRHLQDVEC